MTNVFLFLKIIKTITTATPTVYINPVLRTLESSVTTLGLC